MRKLTVLFIASGRGMGLTFNLSRLAIALKKMGHKVIVVSEPEEEEKGLAEELKQNKIERYRLRGVDSLSVKNTINAVRSMGKIIDSYNVDVIHAQGIRQLIAAFLASRIFSNRKKTGIVASINTTLSEGSHEKITLLIESLTLNVLAGLALPVAKSVANKLINNGLIRNKTVVVYNGIDLELLDDVMRRHRFHSLESNGHESPHGTVIGYFARLVPGKGHAYLLKGISEISKEHSGIRLLLAGSGPLRHELEATARRLGIEKEVLFLGRVSHLKIYELLNKVDVYAFPSSAELFPYAILEAMAAAKPIVATKVGGISEAIENGETGILVAPESPMELAQGIKELIENPAHAKLMGENSRNLIETKFTLHRIAHDLTKCYELSIGKMIHD